MKYYFTLQFTRLKRWLKFLGVHPTVGIVIGLCLFTVLSALLFSKTTAAPWIYLFLAITFLLKLSEHSRNNLLKNNFDTKDYTLVRLIENGIVALPFLFFLLYEGQWLFAIGLILMALLFSLFSNSLQMNFPIPTPFRKFPYEFIVGFRRTFWLAAIVYFLIFKAVQVDNYNLGLFAFAVLLLSSLLFFSKPESKYHVWIYSSNTNHFLLRKYLVVMICLTILSIPAFITLLLFFSESWTISLLVFAIGYVLLGTMILAKYSAFPREMNVLEGILFAVGVVFPPLLMISIWIFYARAKKSLNPILE